MKKVLALVLALAMVLGCFSFVSAAEFTDVAADAAYHDAAAVLSDLGVASGYTDGTFKPEKVVTRAEMAAFIVKALGIAPAASATTTFSDVPASHWASGYVAYATSLGIVSGYTDGSFKPDQTVSYDQAITMLIQALGYTAESLTGTYPAAYVSKAKALGIIDGVDALGTAGANRGDVAVLLYNTLDQTIGHVDNDGYWAATSNKDHTYDNMFARLGAKLYVDAKGDAKNFVVTESMDGVIDLSDYLGKRVTAYVNEDGDIVAIYEVNCSSVYGKLTDTKIGDYKLSGVKSDAEIVFIKNGETQENITTFGAIATGTKYTFACKVKGNYITEVYSAQKWSSDAEDQIDKTDLKKLTADEPTLFGYEFEMTNKDEIDTDEFVLEGVASLDAIAVDDIVTVYVRPTAETISKIVVSKDIVTGKITKLNADKDTATIEGKSYDMADGTFDADFTNTYKFYLNADGDVFAFEKVTDETTDAYGIITDVYCTVDTSKWSSGKDQSGERKINIFTAEGKTETFTLDNTWDEDENEFEVMPEFNTAKYFGDFEQDDEYGYLVIYTLDEDGKLVEITPVADYEEDDDFQAVEVEAIDEDGMMDVDTSHAATFASKAVVFSYDAEDDKWSVMTVAEASAKYTLEDCAALFDKSSTKFVALAAKFTEEDEDDEDGIFGFFLEKTQIAKEKWEVKFLVEDAEETYTIKTTASEKKTFVEGLKFSGEFGEFTYAGTNPSAFTTDTSIKGVTVTVTEDAELDGNTYIVSDDYFCTLAEDIIVYYFNADDDEVTVVKAEDYDDYLTSTDYQVTGYVRENAKTVSYIVVADAE